MIDYIDNGNWEDGEVEENALYDEYKHEMLNFLHQNRERTQQAVTDLYPLLYQGIDAHLIQKTLDEAAFWYNLPDGMAHGYARDRIAELAEFDDEFWQTMGLEVWIEHHTGMYALLEDEPYDVDD